MLTALLDKFSSPFSSSCKIPVGGYRLKITLSAQTRFQLAFSGSGNVCSVHKPQQLAIRGWLKVVISGLRVFPKQNQFLSAGLWRIRLTVYIDEFEVCNPVGTSKSKHKFCAMHWILSNLPRGQHSSLLSIYLAVLCKSNNIKEIWIWKSAWTSFVWSSCLGRTGGICPTSGSKYLRNSPMCSCRQSLCQWNCRLWWKLCRTMFIYLH